MKMLLFQSDRLSSACFVIVLIAVIPAMIFAQPLTVRIKQIDAETPPYVRFTAEVHRGGKQVSATAASFGLTDNGANVIPKVLCRKAYNSVAFVMQNHKGWTVGGVDQDLKSTATTVINGLHPNDECLVVSYENLTAPVLDATTDKTAATAFVDSMQESQSTTFDLDILIKFALTQLAARDGRRICVVNVPNSMALGRGFDFEDIVALAQENGIEIYAITSLSDYVHDFRLHYMANATGGRFFVQDRSDPAPLQKVATDIAAEIAAPSCAFYYTPACNDSLHAMELTVNLDGETAATGALFRWDAYSDTVHLNVNARVTDVDPTTIFDIDISIDPPFTHKDIYEISFLIRYDPSALVLRSPKSGSYRNVTNIIRPGLIQCSFDYGYETFGSVFSWRLKAWSLDSSRASLITIDSVVFQRSCPHTVIVKPDTVFICQCNETIAAGIGGAGPITGDEVRLPVVIANAVPGLRGLLQCYVHFDPGILEPIGIDAVGAAAENALLDWRIKNGDTLEVRTDVSFLSSPGTTFFYARFRVKKQKAPVRIDLVFPSVRIMADCCYDLLGPDTSTLLVDGLCDKVVRRRPQFTLHANIPNPVQEHTIFRFEVHEAGAAVRSAVITLYRTDGMPVAHVFNGLATPGLHEISYNTSALAAGTYYYVLAIGGRAQTRSLTVIH